MWISLVHHTSTLPSLAPNSMVKEQLFERPARSYCEKIAPSVDCSVANGIHYVPLKVKPFKKLGHISSINVENNGDCGQQSSSEEKYSSFIDGTKMKTGAPSVVGWWTTS
ncbi:hypothetical protein Tco_1061612, partial [Tanacetum coccineum]